MSFKEEMPRGDTLKNGILRFLISLPVLSQMAEKGISKGASPPLDTPLGMSMLMPNVRVNRVLQLVKVTEYSACKHCQE